MEMETADVDLVSTGWNDLPDDLQMKILSWLPVECVYSFRIVSKEWKDLLSSDSFLTRWSEVSNNPRLVLCDMNPETPWMSFCFETRSWIKPCFTLSFLKDSMPHTSIIMSSDQGLCLVRPFLGRFLIVCNPYTQTFVEIPPPPSREWGYEQIVVDENKHWRSETAYKVVAVGHTNGSERVGVHIYEASQKRWNFAGYLPDDVILPRFNSLLFCNGSFYCYWKTAAAAAGRNSGWRVLGFTIPLEGNGNGSDIIPVQVLVPFPEIVREVDLVVDPLMITCRSRLLLIAAKRMPVRVRPRGRGRRGRVKQEVVIILWELRNDEWVEITRMPPLVCREWMNKIPGDEDCISCYGVGDHVCFVALSLESEQRIVVLDYNLIDNTWNWLPSCPRNESFIQFGRVAFQPRPYMKVK